MEHLALYLILYTCIVGWNNARRIGAVCYTRITSISATNHFGHNHIGHIEDHIGHRQSLYLPQVDIGHTISATNV